MYQINMLVLGTFFEAVCVCCGGGGTHDSTYNVSDFVVKSCHMLNDLCLHTRSIAHVAHVVLLHVGLLNLIHKL